MCERNIPMRSCQRCLPILQTRVVGWCVLLEKGRSLELVHTTICEKLEYADADLQTYLIHQSRCEGKSYRFSG